MSNGTCELCGKALIGRQTRFCCKKHQRRIAKREARERGAMWAQNVPVDKRLIDLTCSICEKSYRGHAPNKDATHRFTYCSSGCEAEGKRQRYGKTCEHGWVGRVSCPECADVAQARRVQKYLGRVVKERDMERRAIHTMDPCAYCSEPGPNGIDHIIPQSAGGADEWDNWTSCCRRCNGQKGTLPLLGFLLWQQVAPLKSSLDAEASAIQSMRPPLAGA